MASLYGPSTPFISPRAETSAAHAVKQSTYSVAVMMILIARQYSPRETALPDTGNPCSEVMKQRACFGSRDFERIFGFPRERSWIGKPIHCPFQGFPGNHKFQIVIVGE